MLAKTLFSYDTKLSADSVEWCPHSGSEDILAVGTYQVNKSENDKFDDTQRYGRLYLFKCQNSTYKVSNQLRTIRESIPVENYFINYL